MTVSSLTPVNNYTGNGSVSTFDFDFFIENQNELVVTHTNKNGISNVLEYGIDYSINEIGNENGSYIEFPISGSKYENLANGEILSLSLTLPIKQESKFANSSSLNLVVLEKTFDYLVRILQILNRKIERSIKVQEGSLVTPDFLIQQLENAERNTSMYSSKCEILTKDAELYSENAELQATLAKQSAQESLEVKNELVQGNMFKYQLFDIVQKDHLLTYEKSNGFALLGSFVYKNAVAGSIYGYPDFYAKCLEEKELATETETTLGESTITIYVNDNGHQYYDIADKEVIDAFYESTGVAWFYGIDTENECIVLPQNNYLNEYVLDGEYPVVGNGSALGYTTGENILYGRDQHGGNGTGLVSQLVYPANNSDNAIVGTSAPNNAGTGGTGKYIGVTTDETKSGLIARIKNSSNEIYTYMVVGNTTTDTSWVDVITQVEGGVKDLEDKTLEGIERLKASSTALTNNQITNCLLEIPQRIKLDLTDGVLTLKAGSVIVIPNGFETDGATPKFDYVELLSDKVLSYGGAKDNLVFCFNNTFSVTATTLEKCYSGTTAPTDTVDRRFWYDTTNNVINNYSNDSNESSAHISFPIAIVKCTAKDTFEIKQVFNGMGFIGSTWWMDKGVEALISRGYDNTGNINNLSVKTDIVATSTQTASDRLIVLNKDRGLESITHANYFIGEEEPSRKPTASNLWFNPKTLEWKGYNANLDEWLDKPVLPIAWDKKDSNGVITDFGFYQDKTFRAVGYNDKSEVISWSMPDYSAELVPTFPFTAPCSGVFSTNMQANLTGILYINGITVGAGQGGAGAAFPVGQYLLSKGDVVTKNGHTDSQYDKFFPLKGAN